MEKLGISNEGLAFKFAKNTFIVFLSKVLESLFSYLIIVLISRHLGQEGLGSYSFLLSSMALIFIFSDLGLSPFLTKNLSSSRRNISYLLSSALFIKLILSALLILMVFLFKSYFLGFPFLLLFFVCLLQIFNKLFSLFESVFRADISSKSFSMILIFERILALIGVYIGLVHFQNLFSVFLFLFISSFMRFSISFFIFRNYIGFKKINFLKLYTLLKDAFPFLLIGLFGTIYVRIDSVILSFLTSLSDVGLYNSAYNIVLMFNFVPAIFLFFGFPILSKLFKKKTLVLDKFLNSLLNISILILFPFVVFVTFFGDHVLQIIYGFSTFSSHFSFIILIVTELFVFAVIILGQFLAAGGKQKNFALMTAVGALLNVALNFILIPFLGIVGAALATLLTYFVILLMLMKVVSKYIKFNLSNINLFLLFTLLFLLLSLFFFSITSFLFYLTLYLFFLLFFLVQRKLF